MILKKIFENGKEVFVPISLDEAVNIDESNLVFTDDSYDEYEDRMDELEEEEEDEDDNFDEESFTFNSCDTSQNNKFSHEEISSLVNNALGAAKNVLSSVGGMFKDTSKNPKTKKIVSMLPFMDDEDIHELVMGIIENKEEYKDLDLVSIMPFLSTEDCDILFKKALDENLSNIVSIVPFVSSKALSIFVDEYIDGKYQNVNIEALYPFIDSKDVKKIFKHFMKKEF
ncbi:MAG: hypothetical protein ACI311_06400 [Bacilli bacterium]